MHRRDVEAAEHFFDRAIDLYGRRDDYILQLSEHGEKLAVTLDHLLSRSAEKLGEIVLHLQAHYLRKHDRSGALLDVEAYG